MLKRLAPLVAIAVLLFTLGSSQNVFAISPGDAEDAADAVAGLAILDVVDISAAVDGGASIVVYSLVVSLLVNDEVGLISERPLPLLLGGTGSKPHGNLEKSLLADALATGNEQSGVSGNTFIKVFPLPPDAHQGCVICHADFDDPGVPPFVGALSIRVKLNQ